MNCTQDVIVIDGCAVPRPIFELVKAGANQSGSFQTIGVLYEIPAELRPKPGESIEFSFSQMLQRSAANSARMRTGEGMTYIIGATYDWLKSRADVLHLAMILHINPDR